MGSPAEIAKAFRSARSIVVSSQTPLDGDSVGCEVALLDRAAELAPNAEMRAMNESSPPALYSFLPGCERLEVLAETDDPPAADLLVILDCGDLARFSYLPSRFPDAHVLNIDHHASNPGFGDLNWVAPDRASTGEQVFEILEAAGVTLTPDAARALYLAIVFDTGRFAYSNTRPETHRCAAALVEAGVRPEEIYRAVSRNRSLAALRMMGFAIDHLEQRAAGRIGWVKISARDLETYGASPEDLENLVNLPMMLAGVEVSVLFKELPDNRTKASLRSDRWFDVAAFAHRFGGGGHVRAAGMTLNRPLDEAAERVSAQLVAEFERSRP